MLFFSVSKLKHTAAALAFCAALTACGTKEYQMEDNYVSTSESLYEDYIVSVDEETGPLLEPEKQALLSVGEIDRHITAEQLKIIEKEYKHYVKNPRGRVTIERFMYRAAPYLDYTKKVFRDRNMPEELAYLAFVESGYHPFARSSANAMGMWQFMAATARHCGLTINWWIDERLDPYKATKAAASYLQEMHDEFNDWHLALAAYNAGPGKIRRALEETGTDNFFDLMAANDSIKSSKIRIKKETADYVPRFIAMVKIMRNFDLLGYEAKENDLGKGHKVIEERAVAIKAQRGSDLKAVAKALDMSWREFRDYNPAFLQTVTPMTADTVFYVPASLQAKGLEVSKMKTVAGWSTYTIRRGDTLSGISKKTGVPIYVLRQANTISEPLQIGVRLKIPGSNTYVADKASGKNLGTRPKHDTNYTVQAGDTFGEIANNHGLTLAKLKKANPQVRDVTKIALGQKLYIPGLKTKTDSTLTAQNKPKTAKNSALTAKTDKTRSLAEATQKLAAKTAHYTVKSGDTLYSVAKKHGLTVEELQALNNGISPQGLAVGKKLAVSGKPNPAKTAAKRTPNKTYTVQKGDTLFSIAKLHGMSVEELRAYNTGLTASLNIGQKISIPGSAQTKAPAQKTIVHIVKKGDTLYSIGRNYNVSVDAIVAFNNLKNNSLSVGQKVKIPGPDFQVAARSVQTYKVRKGDSFWSISQKFGMSTDELLALNNMSENATLAIGDKIQVAPH